MKNYVLHGYEKICNAEDFKLDNSIFRTNVNLGLRTNIVHKYMVAGDIKLEFSNTFFVDVLTSTVYKVKQVFEIYASEQYAEFTREAIKSNANNFIRTCEEHNISINGPDIIELIKFLSEPNRIVLFNNLIWN